MKRIILMSVITILLVVFSAAYADGLLPSLTEAVGVSMPSFGETANRFPKEELEEEGSSIERYTDVSEEEFNSFNIHLGEIGASIQDYSVNSNVLTATVLYNESSMSIRFDSKKAEIVITYPPHTFDGWLEKYKRDYADGVEKLNNQDWNGAVEAFKNAGTYRDADAQILNTRYMEGIYKRDSFDWDGAILAFEAVGDYNDAVTQIQETQYLHAQNLYDHGDYKSAYNIYLEIRGYKDVDNLLESNSNLIVAASSIKFEAKIAAFQTVGNLVTFGKYEQDDNTSNGQEIIEWIVLDSQEEKSLLLSKYGLDALPYHTEETRTTWKDSSIRNWLNTDFINIAFSAEERAAILSTQLDNSSSQSSYGRDGGDSTIDQVFLLSYAEANKYLNVRDGNMKPRVSPTEYAKSHAAFSSDKEKTSDGDAAGWWWLRSLGMAVKHAGFVSYTGAAGTSIFTGGWGQGCVRPAVWVDLRLLPNGD